MLFEELRKDNMQAMKDKDMVKKNVLSMAISKCQLVITEKRGKGEEFTDGDCLTIIQKLIKEVEEEAIAFKNAGRDERAQELNVSKEIMMKYLPKMLSEEEIKAEISKLEDKTMPSVMKHFKANFQGKVDMGLVSKIAREQN